MTPARRLGRIVLIALLVGLLIISASVIAYLAGRSSSPQAQTSPTLQTSTTQPAASASADAAPTGCLGGQSHDTTMLLRAQRQAPHTTYGAVEVAAAYFRWAYKYPYPTEAQARTVSRALVAPSATKKFKDLAGSYARAGNITGGQVPDETPFVVSTAIGSWRIPQGATSNRVTVEVAGNYVVDGELSASHTAAIAATLTWDGAGWQLLAQRPPDLDLLRAGGTGFTSGC